MRIAVVGSFTYFENHFPEGWRTDKNMLVLDVFEGDYSWLILLHNFRPDATLFFRPELYPRRLIESLKGIKIAILSEPIPNVVNGKLELSNETELRLRVYRLMDWDVYQWRIFYDKGKQDAIKVLGYAIDEFRPLPIDIATFHPSTRPDHRYDVCFVGKATPHRIEMLDFLRSSSLSFIWVAHGASGEDLAELFRASRIVLNVHADAKIAFEPRIYLAAACGALVISEPLSSYPGHFKGRIIEDATQWNESLLRNYLEQNPPLLPSQEFHDSLSSFSTRKLISDVLMQFKDASGGENYNGGEVILGNAVQLSKPQHRENLVRNNNRGEASISSIKKLSDSPSVPVAKGFSDPSVSIIVNSIDDSRFYSFEQGFIAKSGLKNPELIRISDAISMSEGYNRGAAEASGEWLFFCHDDIEILFTDVSRVFQNAMAKTDMFGPCGTRRLVSGNWYDAGIPHIVGSVVSPDPKGNGQFRLELFGTSKKQVVTRIAALDGLFIACRRRVFDTLQGFDEKRYTGFHGYDTDFSFRAHLANFRLGVPTDMLLLHWSQTNVGGGSQATWDSWERTREQVAKNFAPYLHLKPGERGHQNVQLDSLDHAYDCLNSTRGRRRLFT